MNSRKRWLLAVFAVVLLTGVAAGAHDRWSEVRAAGTAPVPVDWEALTPEEQAEAWATYFEFVMRDRIELLDAELQQTVAINSADLLLLWEASTNGGFFQDLVDSSGDLSATARDVELAAGSIQAATAATLDGAGRVEASADQLESIVAAASPEMTDEELMDWACLNVMDQLSEVPGLTWLDAAAAWQYFGCS